MKKIQLPKLNNSGGFTLLEVLIAALMTGVITAATFQFYVRMDSQTEAQFQLSEAQHLARASMHDIKKNLRMAGYKLPVGHVPFTVSGDTLIIYREGIQPVDTIIYTLEEFNDIEYYRVGNLPSGQQLWKLMKQTNSGTPQVFADFLTGIRYNQLSTSSMEISLQVQTAKEDYSRDQESYQGYPVDGGESYANFKTVLLTERVSIRNIS